jgi:drug/metabolite transporter (DMT)-like permease
MKLATQSDPGTLVAFLVAGVLAGGNAVAVVFSNKELAVLWGAGLRFAVAAAVLLAAMALLRLSLPRGRALAGAVLFGLLNFGAAFGFLYYTLSHMQAGLASTLIALVPLATLMLAVAQRQERVHPAAVMGGLLALAGVWLFTSTC